jgi:hypothetical protein
VEHNCEARYCHLCERKTESLRIVPGSVAFGYLTRSMFVQAAEQIYWFAAVFGLRALYAAKPVADNMQTIDWPDGPMTSAVNSHQLRDAIRCR